MFEGLVPRMLICVWGIASGVPGRGETVTAPAAAGGGGGHGEHGRRSDDQRRGACAVDASCLNPARANNGFSPPAGAFQFPTFVPSPTLCGVRKLSQSVK